MEDIGCLRRESRWLLIVTYEFSFYIVTTLVPPPPKVVKKGLIFFLSDRKEGMVLSLHLTITFYYFEKRIVGLTDELRGRMKDYLLEPL